MINKRKITETTFNSINNYIDKKKCDYLFKQHTCTHTHTNTHIHTYIFNITTTTQKKKNSFKH